MKRKLSHYLDSVSQNIGRVSSAVGEICLFIMALLITVDVIGRALGQPTHIADEMSRYLLIGVIFIGLAHTQLAKRHIDINLVTRLFSQKRQQQLGLAAMVINTAFVWWFFIATTPHVVRTFTDHITSLSYTDTPLWIPQILLPIGAGMLAIVMSIELYYRLSKSKPESKS